MKIFIAGDSTVENGSAPFFGWGGQLNGFLPADAETVNLAKSGRSSKSFLDEGLLAPALEAMRAGDLLLVAFGHNDEKDDAARHTDPATTFPEALGRYLRAATERGATPVLVTSVCRAYFVGDGALLYTHGEYPLAVRALAAREGVPLIDLKAKTRALLLSLGEEKARELFVNLEPGEMEAYPDGHHDKTHFSLTGARTVARLVADALKEMHLIGV